MFVEGVVTDLRGKPIPNATIDTWETDGNGAYDTQVREKIGFYVDYTVAELEKITTIWQYVSRDGPECRGILHSTEDGSYAFRAVVWAAYPFPFNCQKSHDLSRPVSYPIPDDGTVGRMLSKLGRSVVRPAHLHIRINVRDTLWFVPLSFKLNSSIFFQAPGYEELITALYLKGDSYLMSDPVFGVKSSLIVVGFFFFSKLLSLFSFMLTLSSGTQINRWSFDHESTRLQGTKTSCVSEAWLCVGDSRRMRWITKESWSKLTRLSVYLRFLTYPWSYLYIMFSIRISSINKSGYLMISHTNLQRLGGIL